MRKWCAFVVASGLAVASAAAAEAADMSREPILPRFEPLSPIATEFASGWYLRGDLGYRMMRLGSVDAPVTVTSSRINDTWALGAGFGYKWRWFRADLTVDYGAHANVEAATAFAGTQYSARINAITTLANVYLDLGTWGGLTPYVGAGFGPSMLSVAEYRDTPLATPPRPAATWQMSWAAMAGLSYLISTNLAIDVGYRHLHLGDAVSPRDAAGLSTTFKGVSTREVRVGLRLLID